MFLIFLTIVITVVPGSRMIRSWEFQLHFAIALILILVTLWLSPLPFSVRCGLSVVLLLTYRRNFYLLGSTLINMYEGLKMKPALKYKNRALRKTVYSIYKNTGFRIVHNFDKLPEKPTIIVLNYCADRMEHALCAIIPRDVSVISKSIFGKIIGRNIQLPLHKKGQFDYVEEKVKENLDKGIDILAYINAPSYYQYIGALSSGMFRIAMGINATITPITFDTIELTKMCTIPNQNMCVKVGETFSPESVGSAKIRCRRFFKKSLEEFKANKYNFDYTF